MTPSSVLAQAQSDNQIFGRFVPDIDDYNKEPPQLPPHLRHIILNKVSFIMPVNKRVR
jgi:5'-AMP-activated protein kinase regulatory beta subunit